MTLRHKDTEMINNHSEVERVLSICMIIAIPVSDIFPGRIQVQG